MENAKILIVEDDEFLRDLYTDTLKAEKYIVDSAQDGVEAFEKMKMGGYDLILLDIVMPKLNGLEVMREITKTNLPQPNKCVIFLTNLDKGDEIKEALQLGNGYIIKSQITPGDLLNEVNNYLTQNSAPKQEA